MEHEETLIVTLKPVALSRPETKVIHLDAWGMRLPMCFFQVMIHI